jgi:hypothetical protein
MMAFNRILRGIVPLILISSSLQAQLAWKVLGSLKEGRSLFSIAPLGNSQVLVMGGFTGQLFSGTPTRNCEIIDVRNRLITPTSPMSVPRAEFVALVTKDSNVIVLGGESAGGTTASCEIFDRKTQRWQPAGNLLIPRRQHAAQFISDHEILVVGGRTTPSSGISDAEIFDVNTGASKRIADFSNLITNHVAGISSIGNLVVMGGREAGTNSNRSPLVYRYDQGPDRWTSIGRLDTTAQDPRLIKLWDGRLLLSGGATSNSPTSMNKHVWIEQNDDMTILCRMQMERCFHVVGQWSTDSVIVAGGRNNSDLSQDLSEWINVRTGAVTPGPRLNYARAFALGISLPVRYDLQAKPTDAVVLAISGLSIDNTTNTPTVEILEYPCISYARRSIDTAICAGENVTFTVPNAYSSFQWSTLATSRSITVTQPGTYWVTGTAANGCSMSDTMVVAMRARPKANAGSDVTTCSEIGVVIGDAASGGTPPYSYSWGPAAGLSADNVASPTASPSITTRYSVHVVDANGCWDTASVTVNVTQSKLQVLLASSGNEVNIQSTAVGEYRCDSIRLHNQGSTPISISEAAFLHGSAFSVAEDQLPLAIPAGALRSILICYYPSALGVDRDTLSILGDCLAQTIPLFASSMLNVQSSGGCASGLQFKLDTSAYLLKAYPPFPNPNSTILQIPIELVKPGGMIFPSVHCILVDVMGNEVANGVYASSTSEHWSSQMHELGCFTIDTRAVSQGFYFVRILSAEGMQVFPVVVRR